MAGHQGHAEPGAARLFQDRLANGLDNGVRRRAAASRGIANRGPPGGVRDDGSRMINLAGKFIVFDGNEGSGKSTQAKLLQERLERERIGLESLFVRDPGYTRIGEQIRALLLNPENDEMA